jgi:hypothetical protein
MTLCKELLAGIARLLSVQSALWFALCKLLQPGTSVTQHNAHGISRRMHLQVNHRIKGAKSSHKRLFARLTVYPRNAIFNYLEGDECHIWFCRGKAIVKKQWALLSSLLKKPVYGNGRLWTCLFVMPSFESSDLLVYAPK